MYLALEGSANLTKRHLVDAANMSGELAASVLLAVLGDVKKRGGRVEDAQAQALAALTPAELAELRAATELVARGAVARVEASPSGRRFFRVRSLRRFRRADEAAEDSQMDAEDAQPDCYTCWEHFCSCSRFLELAAVSPVAMVRCCYYGLSGWEF